MPTQTTEQARATYATHCVQAALAANPKQAGHYRSYARQWGTLVHTNGLGQALAFARSKAGAGPKRDDKEAAWKLLYDHTSQWLTGTDTAHQLPTPKPLANNADADALTAITTTALPTYLLATAEAIALAVWLKRLAEALIEKPNTEARD